jgi:hypothetical protein
VSIATDADDGDSHGALRYAGAFVKNSLAFYFDISGIKVVDFTRSTRIALTHSLDLVGARLRSCQIGHVNFVHFSRRNSLRRTRL